MARIVLAMSGGVDSSVAAHLLVEAGHDVIGVFMRHGQQSPIACSDASPSTTLPILSNRLDHKQGCCTASDAADARRVAEGMNIPFYAVNFEEEFTQIIDYFVDEYVAGRTPNPCVMCNNWLKFGKLFVYADQVDAEFVATGHYARIGKTDDGEPTLLRGLDRGKDQSYVLFGIERRHLDRMMLPVGGFEKPAIRAMAKELGLGVADKKDSQEICFVTNDDYAQFVEARLAMRDGEGVDAHGEIVTVEGEVVGQHTGVQNFTVGQRKGLRVAVGEPRYVVSLDSESRRVVIGTREQLARHDFTASKVNWLIDMPTSAIECEVMIRYLSAPAAATVTPLDDHRIAVELHETRDGVAPGQAVVCYQGDRVLGGGWIE